MNVRARFLAVSALALLGATAAQAEAYEGVQAPVSALDRAAVHAEAVAAAHAPNQNVPSGSVVLAPLPQSRDRLQVQAEAVRAAYAPDQNVTPGSRVDSQLASTLPNPADLRAAGGSQPARRF